MSIPRIAIQRVGVRAILHAVGRAAMHWWVAYTTWRIEQWVAGRLAAVCDRRGSQLAFGESECGRTFGCPL